jgi:hypothetical protein
MANPTTLLPSGVFKIGAAVGSVVDYTDQVKSVVVTKSRDALDATSFGNTGYYRVGGLTDCVITVTLLVNDTMANALSALVGTNCYAAARRSSGAISTSNPEYQLTGAYFESFDVVNATVGELSEVEVVVSGGALVEDTTP